MASTTFQNFEGKHITVHILNNHFYYQAVMLLEHFDIPEFSDCVINVGDYVHPKAISNLRLAYPNKKIVIYQLEQLVSQNHWWPTDKLIKRVAEADEVWDYDPLNAIVLQKNGIKVNRIIPMLYTRDLDKIQSKEDPHIDVLFYGTGNERRFKILQDIQYKNFMGLNIVWSAGPLDNDEFISNSKVILNLHAYDLENRQEQTRIFYPVINGKTVVSETSTLNNMRGCVIEIDIHQLSVYMKYIVQNNIWKYYGLSAKEKLKAATEEYMHNFHNSLKAES